METAKITLAIDSKLENVAWVGLATNIICSTIPELSDFSNRAELCVVEACNNAIEHAYCNEPNHTVEIIITQHHDRITFEICNTGTPIDMEKCTPSLHFVPGNPETYSEKGMGLFIMSEVMDEVIHRSIEGKNVITLTKFFNSTI